MADELTAIIAEMRRLCDRADEIIAAGNRPLVELAEVEPDEPDGYDNPESEYWEARCFHADEKLSGINFDAREKAYQEWDLSWTWRQIAELYERRIAELKATNG